MTETTIVTKEKMLEYMSEARRLLARFQDPMWAVTAEQTDDEHLAEYKSTLTKTREYYPDMPEKTAMNAVMGESNIVYAFTGNSPTSGDRAKAIVGFINTLPFLLDSLVASLDLKEAHAARVSELLDHNSKQFMENRAQRATIRKLQAQVTWLMEQIPAAQRTIEETATE